MTEFHHGITAKESALGKIPIRNADTNTIAMLAYADDADEDTFPLNTPVLVTSINRVLSKAGVTGNLRKNLEIISTITSPTLVVIRIANPFINAEFDQSLVIGTTVDNGQRTGLQALLTVKSKLGLTPKIICVSDTETIDVANALGAICKKLRAYSYITPRDDQGVIFDKAEDVVNFRNLLAFREIELIWPEWTSGSVFLVTESPNNDPISCVGAISEAVLISTNLPSDLANPPTVNIYVNSVLISKNVSTNYINQQWFTNPLLKLNASQLGYSVFGDSSHQEYFHNSSNSPITFEFVPNSDGLYDGVDYLAKDALIISESNNNPTAYKDPTTGVLSFCLAAFAVGS